MFVAGVVTTKTMDNKMMTLAKTWDRFQCCPPVSGVGTDAFTIYQVWSYHITVTNYDIDPIKNNTYFTS